MEENSLQNNQSTQLNKGLITDASYNNLPVGAWSYALNLVNETKQGDKGFIANEYGNSQCLNMTIDGKVFIPVGSINLIGEEVVLFLATADQSDSRIIIQNGCNRTDIVYTIGVNSASCLNFSEYHPVTGIAKIRKGCNRVIYFRDSYNSDKSIDLDEILNSPDNNRYYNTTDGWNCGLFKLASDFIFPELQYGSTSDSGGNLKLGVYQFGISLGDEDLNFTSVLDVTLPVPIVSGQLNGNFYEIEGGDPLKESSPTTKSINLSLSNLDTDYEYVRIYVIETISGVTTAYLADTLAIDSGTLNYTYRGVDLNSATVVSINDINTNVTVYDKSKSMEQQDQRLLRANLEEKNIDYSAWQISANLIQTRYVTKPIEYATVESVQSGSYYADNRSYMRDEIYALGISGVFTDGTTTPVFHIPGRAINEYSTGGTISDANDPFGPAGTQQTNRKAPIVGDGWDSSEYTVVYAETVGNPISATDFNWTQPLVAPATWADLAANEVSVEDARPFNKIIGDTIERWVLYNTSYQEVLNDIYSTHYSEGQLAYWESSYAYPNILSCSGERLFPEGNIRHHKMPDTTMEPHFIAVDDQDLNSYIISLGLEFDLTNFISELQTRLGSDYSEIQGFKISRVKREKGNKTILDKGLAFRHLEMTYDIGASPVSTPTDFLLQNNFFNKHVNIHRDATAADRALEGRSYNDFDQDNVLPPFDIFSSGDASNTGADFKYSTSYISIHNPKSQFLKETNYQYIKMEKELYGSYEYWGDTNSWTVGDRSRSSWRVQYVNYNPSGVYKGTPLPYFTNRLKYNDYYVNTNQNTTFDGRQEIGRASQEVYLGEIDLFPDVSADGSSYAGGPMDLDGSTINHGGKLTFWEDGTWTTGIGTNSKAYYVSLKNYNAGIYNQLNTLTYYPIHSYLLPTNSTTVELYGGDIFISQVASRTTNLDNVASFPDESTVYQNLYSYFVESEVNCKLRDEGYGLNNYAGWYYPYHGTGITEIQEVISEVDYLVSDATTNEDLVTAFVAGNYSYNKYNYNQDYSKEIGLKPNFPLPLGFNYCSQCLNKFPYRIVFSERSFQEDRSDSYRKFLPNNYRDISAGTGEIFNLFRESDTLFVRTEQSLWYIPTKQQEMKTDAGTIQIGTGEFFSMPPKELVSSVIGYNGGQTTLDLIVNEYGALYADAGAGIVFQTKVGKGQIEISKEGGNRLWFEENLPFALLSHTPLFPDVDAPTSRSGIGLVGYYDPQVRRYILTKKDYYPIYPDVSVYVSDTHDWLINGVTVVSNPYISPLYFENRSWTISYSLEENMWLSWHSYLPNYGWNTRSSFSTYKQGSNYTWKHNDGEFQTFYGEKYPHIFEFVNTKDPLQTKISNTLSYICNVQEYSPFTKQWLDIKNDTFNKGIFYNSTQSTGELDIAVKNSNDPFASVLTSFDPGQIFAERTESNWNINNIRDMVDQTTPEQPLFTSDWVSIKNTYFTDKVPNSAVLNYLTKPQYEMEELRDSFMVCRLSYKNALNNRRIITKYLSNNSNISIR